jgi:hypothetical protein
MYVHFGFLYLRLTRHKLIVYFRNKRWQNAYESAILYIKVLDKKWRLISDHIFRLHRPVQGYLLINYFRDAYRELVFILQILFVEVSLFCGNDKKTTEISTGQIKVRK